MNIAISRLARQRLIAAAVLAFLVPAAAAAQWRLASPPAAASWFNVLDSLGVAGTGAFRFTASGSERPTDLGRTLSRGGRYDILHFVPLYYPSAGTTALADALTQAAGNAPPAAPRAQFLVGALRQALPATAERAPLLVLANGLRRSPARRVTAASLDALQAHWNRALAPALAAFLHDQQLDAGLLWVLPALGPEGRLFAGVATDRTDNIVAVAANPADGNGPLYAAVRELCFPLVSRAAEASPEFRRTVGSPADAARRTGVAAVRCGAALLDHVAPAEAGPYRTHWLRVANRGAVFDAAFPTDAVLAPSIRAALARYSASH
ncbi:MAG: hypothetical protein Q8K55_06190 [Gemmatimonadaceae bacterium]|nr:hypothetical protein [Gemmatimonadaceae bacterium]